MKWLLVCSTLTTIALISCLKIRECRLELNRMDYHSAELRVQGYYYSVENDGTILPTYILYRNGVLLKLYGGPYTEMELSNAEADWLSERSEELRRDVHLDWGIFLVHQDKIVIETWGPSRGGAPPLYRIEGYIVNDSIFVTTEFKNCLGEAGRDEDTYYFKHLAQKPDSTNTVIE